MKITTYDTREEWLSGRLGKITGTRVKDLISKRASTAKKIGFYEMIAERIAVPSDGENAMERGQRLEPEAVERFVQETGKKVDTSLVIWERDDNSRIAISPDGFIGLTEGVEVKCLSSARHIEAFITKEIPDEYKDQAIQYFVVNDKLETLYSVFYDPRLSVKDYFVIETKRSQVEEKIVQYLEYEKTTLEEVEQIIKDLSF